MSTSASGSPKVDQQHQQQVTTAGSDSNPSSASTPPDTQTKLQESTDNIVNEDPMLIQTPLASSVACATSTPPSSSVPSVPLHSSSSTGDISASSTATAEACRTSMEGAISNMAAACGVDDVIRVSDMMNASNSSSSRDSSAAAPLLPVSIPISGHPMILVSAASPAASPHIQPRGNELQVVPSPSSNVNSRASSRLSTRVVVKDEGGATQHGGLFDLAHVTSSEVVSPTLNGTQSAKPSKADGSIPHEFSVPSVAVARSAATGSLLNRPPSHSSEAKNTQSRDSPPALEYPRGKENASVYSSTRTSKSFADDRSEGFPVASRVTSPHPIEREAPYYPPLPNINSLDTTQTIIECGELLPNGKRVMSVYSDFFGKEVELYMAVGDPYREHLYRASALAEKFGYATNKVGMYLARRRTPQSGIYQAASFKCKPPGRTGLKSGGYFLTIRACKDFEKHFGAPDEFPNSSRTSAPTQRQQQVVKKKLSGRHSDSEENASHQHSHSHSTRHSHEDVTMAQVVKPNADSKKAAMSVSEAEASANLALLAQLSSGTESKHSNAVAPASVSSAGKKRSAEDMHAPVANSTSNAHAIAGGDHISPSKKLKGGASASPDNVGPSPQAAVAFSPTVNVAMPVGMTVPVEYALAGEAMAQQHEYYQLQQYAAAAQSYAQQAAARPPHIFFPTQPAPLYSAQPYASVKTVPHSFPLMQPYAMPPGYVSPFGAAPPPASYVMPPHPSASALSIPVTTAPSYFHSSPAAPFGAVSQPYSPFTAVMNVPYSISK